MHFIYIDDSRDERLCVFSALAIPVENWKAAFSQVKQFRRALKVSDSIYVYKELHAWKFVKGKGRISPQIVTKYRRSRIFIETLQMVAQLPGARLMNAVFPAYNEAWAFERLLNRINRTMQEWDSHALLLCDEGKNAVYTRLARRMGVYNPIPSQFGIWPEGAESRNIPIERIIEDPIFKDSRQSYFIQLVDFCAYALLRREKPTPHSIKYGLDQAFNALRPILVLECNRFDPGREGIIRPK